jgi:hypothetical protein
MHSRSTQLSGDVTRSSPDGARAARPEVAAQRARTLAIS